MHGGRRGGKGQCPAVVVVLRMGWISGVREMVRGMPTSLQSIHVNPLLHRLWFRDLPAATRFLKNIQAGLAVGNSLPGNFVPATGIHSTEPPCWDSTGSEGSVGEEEEVEVDSLQW